MDQPTLDTTLCDASGEVRESSPLGTSLIGTTVADRYLVVEHLGSGGFGQVFRARDLRLEREVALKVIERRKSSGQPITEDALREARSLAQLKHSNIVPVYDAGSIDGLPFLTMGLISGRPLEDLIEENGPFPLNRTLELFTQLGSALDYAHRNGILHRDIKPENLLIDDEDRLHIVDFGIACLKQEMREAGASLTGTPRYLAPEILDGKPASARSDVFSAAAVLYRLLSGTEAFQGSSLAEITTAICKGARPKVEPDRSDLPAGVDSVIAKGLAIEPDDRYPTCSALAKDLRRCVQRRRLVRAGIAVAISFALVVAVLGIRYFFQPLQLDVSLQYERPTEGKPIPLVESSVLRHGDAFWISELKVNRSAYVAAILLDTDGVPQLLAPEDHASGIESLVPGTPYRFPEGNHGWNLDENSGTETVFVIGSQDPLSADQVQGFLDQIKADLEAEAPQGRLRGVEGTRSLVSVRERKERQMEERLREAFPVVQRYSFQHAPGR